MKFNFWLNQLKYSFYSTKSYQNKPSFDAQNEFFVQIKKKFNRIIIVSKITL